MNSPTTPIRVLIVEDSPAYREMLVKILQNSPDFRVVGTAKNGAEGVHLAHRLKPDVITMDIHMPEMDGFEATRLIMAETPRPIVMISASLDKSQRDLTFNALQSGALSVLEKPTVNDSPEIYQALAEQIRLMAEVKVIRRRTGAASRPALPSEPPALVRAPATKIRLVAIASSTGGPGVLAEILGQLPATFPVPILIVQHITPGFGAGLASWLNQHTPLDVHLASQGDEPKAGQVLIAPDDQHMIINSMGRVALSTTPPVMGLRPAANILFHSLAQVYGAAAVGIILTGMGGDGAEGLQAMRRTGAHTIAQDKESCVVFGMPAVAIELGAAEQILPVNQIAIAMTALVS